MFKTLKSLLAGVGVLAMLILGAGLASAQTSTYTPGVPTTGAGGDVSSNLVGLGASALLIAAGVTLLRKGKITQ